MLVFAASRWPGMLPQNFSAAHALLFCAAFWLPGWMGWVLPLATIIVTDILLNLFHYSMPVMVPELVVNWMILALFVVLAKWLARRRSYGRVFLGTLIGALLFYLVSNTVSWLVNPVYAKSIAGWVQALTVGSARFSANVVVWSQVAARHRPVHRPVRRGNEMERSTRCRARAGAGN